MVILTIMKEIIIAETEIETPDTEKIETTVETTEVETETRILIETITPKKIITIEIGKINLPETTSIKTKVLRHLLKLLSPR